MKRRGFVAGVCIATTAPTFFRALPVYAQDLGEDIEIVSPVPSLPSNLEQYSHLPPATYDDFQLTGPAAPTPNEVEKAYRILIESPYGVPPLEVAQYFLDLSGGDESYAREWPVRANPVIYHFFAATGTKPSGDVTPWCAAFVNWVLLRSKAASKTEIGWSKGSASKSGEPFSAESYKKYSTKSAASGSFRCLTPAEPAKKGDILVLANKGTRGLACSGTGHVAFFMDFDKNGASSTAQGMVPTHVYALGGNQLFKGTGGAITIGRFDVRPGTRFLRFVRAPA